MEKRTIDLRTRSAGQGDPPIRERRPAMSRSALSGRDGWICERRRHISFGTLPGGDGWFDGAAVPDSRRIAGGSFGVGLDALRAPILYGVRG